MGILFQEVIRVYKIRVYGERNFLSALPEKMARHCEQEEAPDMVLIMPGSAGGRFPEAPTVIAPAECPVKARQLITYGAGPRDTVTFSSMSGDYQVLSLQREIVTLDGKRLERQDIPLPPNNKPQKTLALCSLMLAAGIPPSGLAGRLKDVL